MGGGHGDSKNCRPMGWAWVVQARALGPGLAEKAAGPSNPLPALPAPPRTPNSCCGRVVSGREDSVTEGQQPTDLREEMGPGGSESDEVSTVGLPDVGFQGYPGLPFSAEAPKPLSQSDGMWGPLLRPSSRPHQSML